jgi:hypothetical protein
MDAENPECWITLWSEDNYKGNARTFTNPQSVNDLAEYTYDNSRQEVDDSANALKTGAKTWCCLYDGESYGGDMLKVGPDTTIPKLGDVPRNGWHTDFKNRFASLILFDTRPGFWEYTDDKLAGDCWLKIYLYPRYTGRCTALYGVTDMVDDQLIGGFPCTDGDRYVKHPGALSTGPSTWVEFYKDRNYGHLMDSFGPNSIVPDLASYYNGGAFGSLRIYSAPPDNFSSSAPIPPEVLSIQKYQTSQKLKEVLSGVLRLAPGGGLLAGLLGVLWPQGPSITEQWKDMTQYTMALAQSLIEQNNLKELTEELEGLYDFIAVYLAMPPSGAKAGALNDIISFLILNRHKFTDAKPSETNLTYLVAFGSIYVAAEAERAYNFSVLSGGQADTYQTDNRTSLDQTIAMLQQAVGEAVTTICAWRVKQIAYANHGVFTTQYLLTDALTGYSQDYSNQPGVEAAQQQLRTYVEDQYRLQLEAYTSPAALWSFFGTANTTTVADSGNPHFPTTAFTQKPTPHLISRTVSTYPTGAAGTPFAEQANGGRITGIVLHYDKELDFSGYAYYPLTGIEFRYDNQQSGLHGRPGAASTQVDFEENEEITGLYGASSDYLSQVFFRTNKGRDFGTGGSQGQLFTAIGPQGVGATITGVSGVSAVGSKKYIGSLAITWSYDVPVLTPS